MGNFTEELLIVRISPSENKSQNHMGNFTEELFIFLHRKVSQNLHRKLRPHLLQVDNPFAIFAPLQLSGRTTSLFMSYDPCGFWLIFWQDMLKTISEKPTRDSQSSWRRTFLVASKLPPFRACLSFSPWFCCAWWVKHSSIKIRVASRAMSVLDLTLDFLWFHIDKWYMTAQVQHKDYSSDLMCGTPGGAWTVNLADSDFWSPDQHV